VLKKKAKTGWTKVMNLTRMMEPEELYSGLAPGRYIVHKYEKGSTGFVEAGPVFDVVGETTEEGATLPRRPSPFAGLREFAEDMKTMKADLVESFGILGPMIGFSSPGEGEPKSLIDQLKEAKENQTMYNELFPLSTTGQQDIPVTGEIPAWLVYAPKVIDNSLNSIEQRLIRWDLISPEDAGVGKREEFIELPGRPAAAKSETKKPETEKTEGIVPKVEIPKRPEVAKEKGIETDKKGGDKKGGKKGGGGGEKSATAS